MSRYDDDSMINPVKANGLSTEHAAAILVFAALLFLILVRRGFRGITVSA